MANNYEPTSVNTEIPAAVINPVDLDLFDAFGLEYEPSGKGEAKMFYFFSEEGMNTAEPVLTVKSLKEYSSMIVGEFGEDMPDYVRRFKTAIDALIEEGEDHGDIELYPIIDVDELFQDILTREGWDERPAYIEVAGAFYCQKMRPREFGGFCTRIYPDEIVTIDTVNTIDRVLKLERQVRALRTAAEHAVATYESADEVTVDAVQVLKDAMEQAA